MTLSSAEIPGSTSSRVGANHREALPTVTRHTKSLYTIVLSVLGAALLLLIGGWILLSALEKPVPETLPVVIATIVGALAGVIATDRAGA